MHDSDYQYIFTTVSRLSSLPVRVYENEEPIWFYSPIPLVKDPAQLCRDQLLNASQKIGYVITDTFDFYGLLFFDEKLVALGPACMTPHSEQELRRMAFDLEVAEADIPSFVTSMQSILPLPLEFLLEMICLINYTYNGERLQLSDLMTSQENQAALSRQVMRETVQETYEEAEESHSFDIYRTYQVEQEILDIVKSGNVEKLFSWLKDVPAVRPGQIASNVLEQNRNNFIVTTTLASRAAIQGGMDVEEALKLSDRYMRKAQLTGTIEGLSNLMLSMITAYTQSVGQIREFGAKTQLVQRVTAYVRHHLSEAIRTEDIAKALYMGRSHLSTRFKEEQGENLTDYIQKVKITEAKHLLHHTDKSLLTISNYLGYSSQSHFCRIFRSIVGVTPGQYRKNA